MLGGVSRLSRPTPTAWLTAAALGVYLLVVVGATASLADAAQACSSWPACHGSLGEPAVGHRLLAAIVGLLVLLASVAVLRAETSRRVKLATALGLVLYPAQIAVGAALATSAGMTVFPGLHLLVGLSIFGALVVALAWHLELETGGVDNPLSQEALKAKLEEAPPEPTTTAMESGATDGQQPPTPFAEQPLGIRLRKRAFAYFRLMKPRLMWLLCLVAAAAMALAGGPGLSVRTIVFTLGGGVLAIGASGTFNHVFERDRDRRMSRTNDRPVATYQVPERNALLFGLSLTALSIGIFLQVNPLAAALGLVAIMFYSLVYTLVLKPNTAQNTVIGGAAGSLPALIGWAAVTGRIDVAGLALAGLIFVWTPAHFYNAQAHTAVARGDTRHGNRAHLAHQSWLAHRRDDDGARDCVPLDSTPSASRADRTGCVPRLPRLERLPGAGADRYRNRLTGALNKSGPRYQGTSVPSTGYPFSTQSWIPLSRAYTSV